MKVYRAVAYIDGEIVDEQVIITYDSIPKVQQYMQNKVEGNATVVVGVLSDNPILIYDGRDIGEYKRSLGRR